MRKPRKAREPLPGSVVASPHELKEENNPFTDRDWRMLAYAWSGFALRILLVLGAVFSAVQYLQAREEKRIERTLALVELWERSDYQEAQAAVKQRLAELNRQSAGLITDKTTQEELAIITASIGSQALTEGGGTMPIDVFAERFDRVVYFLSRLASCVEGNLCDERVADEFFLDYAQSFWRYFSDHIARERRRGAPSLAVAIEHYVTRPR